MSFIYFVPVRVTFTWTRQEQEQEQGRGSSSSGSSCFAEALSTCSKQLAEGCNGAAMMTMLAVIMMSLERMGVAGGGWSGLGLPGRLHTRVQAAVALRSRGWSTKWAAVAEAS